MSIRILNETVTFCWQIPPATAAPSKADWDVLVHKPDGSSAYTDDGITTYVAPTATTQGQATFDLLINQLGRWQVTLAEGTNTLHVIQAFREIYVVAPPSYVIAGTPAKITQGPEIIPEIPIPALPIWKPAIAQPFNVTSDAHVSGSVLFYGGTGGKAAYSLDAGITFIEITTGIITTVYQFFEDIFVYNTAGADEGVGYSSDYSSSPFTTNDTLLPGFGQRSLLNTAYQITDSPGPFTIYELTNAPAATSVYSGFSGGVAEIQKVANQEQGGFLMANNTTNGVIESLNSAFGNKLTVYTDAGTVRILTVMPSNWASNPCSCWGDINGRITHFVSGTAYHDTVTFSNPIQSIAISPYSGYMLAVAGTEIGYMKISDIGTDDAWTLADNPSAYSFNNVYALEEGTGFAFIATTSGGSIYRSVNGF